MLTELRREKAPGCLTDLVFDEWTAGELSAGDVARLEAHVATCGACTERKAQLQAAAARFFREAKLPVARNRPLRTRPWLAGAGTVLALAAASALYLRGTVDDAVGSRTKGSAHVAFFVKRGNVVSEGSETQRLRAGDELRFVVTTDEPRHLVLLGLDSRGTVSVFSPSPEESIPVAPGQATPLDASVRLDDSPGRERLFALFCDAPLRVAPVAAALRASGGVAPPAGCALQELSLQKEVP